MVKSARVWLNGCTTGQPWRKVHSEREQSGGEEGNVEDAQNRVAGGRMLVN